MLNIRYAHEGRMIWSSVEREWDAYIIAKTLSKGEPKAEVTLWGHSGLCFLARFAGGVRMDDASPVTKR